MSDSSLSAYLNDHLAGSVIAIRLLESLESTYSAHDHTQEIAEVAERVRREVEQDRDVLARVIAELGVDESTVRKAAGWFAERFAQAKMAGDDDGDGTFRLLEMAEVVALGILGKRGLWLAMQSNATSIPAARGLDFDALVARANAQYERMEVLRLGAARAVFGAVAA